MREQKEVKRYRYTLTCDNCDKFVEFVTDEGSGHDDWPTGWFIGSRFDQEPSLDFCSDECVGTYFDALRKRVYPA